MSIMLDYQLRERIPDKTARYPVAFFCDELASLPDCAGPLHWHTDFEIATASSGVLDFQVGLRHIRLEAGESIFVNENIMHGIRQLSGDKPDPMPNIVFSGDVIAPETDEIYRKYIQPIACCDEWVFILFNRKNGWHKEVNGLIKNINCSYNFSTLLDKNVILKPVFSGKYSKWLIQKKRFVLVVVKK